MKLLKSIFLTLWTTVAGMRGGQGPKWVRRYGIPLGALVLNGVPFLLLIPILMTGYGENSILMNYLHNDSLVRLVYSFLLSLPFMFYGLKRFIWALVFLVIAFQVRAGSLGNISWFGDVLVEDLFRYGTLGILISFNIFKLE